MNILEILAIAHVSKNMTAASHDHEVIFVIVHLITNCTINCLISFVSVVLSLTGRSLGNFVTIFVPKP